MQPHFSIPAWDQVRCSKCQEFKDWNGGKGWRGRHCQQCVNAIQRQWHADNPERSQEINRRRLARRAESDPDWQRKWLTANPGYHRKWRAANPEKATGRERRRRARKSNASCQHGPNCFNDRAATLPRRCAVRGCRRRKNLQADHIMPLALGGKDCGDNCQILCGHHNASKWATPPDQWAVQMGRLLA